MPQIVQQGAINNTAQVVPDLSVVIVPPAQLLINGVPTNVLGIVGTAPWGPVGQPVVCSSMADYARAFGPVMPRKFDAGTQVATAVQQGASNFRVVRVTDGTDLAATISGPTGCIAFTSIYTGTLGNSFSVAISAGSKFGSFRAVVQCPGLPSEVFDNLTGSGNAFWVAMAAAINNGNAITRGPSLYITAAASAGTTAAAAATYTLTGGTDGVATITSTVLIGVDTIPRKGMYALRGQGCSLGLLADADDYTQWTVQAQFGQAEGLYMFCVGAAGLAISNGSTGIVDIKGTAGLDFYSAKILHGDWLWWQDQTNGVLRLVSPQGFAAGLYANMSPERSGLNKPLFGIAGSQKTGAPGSNQGSVYSTADLQLLFQNGVDVITNPAPGGRYWALRLGHNSSSNASIHGDNYTRMTNYIAATLAAGMGVYVGRVINAELLRAIRSTLLSYLAGLLSQGILGSVDGSLPYSVICDVTDNPDSRTSLGYVQADVQVKYQAINEFFSVNLEGGQTVQVQKAAGT